MAQEQVILVDANDKVVGYEEKLKAHQQGLLHRAFSVFIFNNKGELLLQRRAMHKYHSAGLWTNTCCSHQRPDEDTVAAARRRLKEEMGMECEVKPLFSFIYRTEFENGLIEHELDHVLIGTCNDNPSPDAEEVMEWEWVNTSTLLQKIHTYPEHYTYWFRQLLPKVLDAVKM
jgi:isopentenyl-diphosphate delta-isomerase